jgi:hypothetical protein
MVWLYSGRLGAEAVDTPGAPNRALLGWSAGAVAAALLTVAVLCAPFDVAGTPTQWRHRYESMWTVPFARLHAGTQLNAISDVAKKLVLFGLFGALAMKAMRSVSLPSRLRIMAGVLVALLGAGLAFGIEILQVMLPSHFPDVTDVILGGLGAAAGAALVLFL